MIKAVFHFLEYVDGALRKDLGEIADNVVLANLPVVRVFSLSVAENRLNHFLKAVTQDRSVSASDLPIFAIIFLSQLI